MAVKLLSLSFYGQNSSSVHHMPLFANCVWIVLKALRPASHSSLNHEFIHFYCLECCCLAQFCYVLLWITTCILLYCEHDAVLICHQLFWGCSESVNMSLSKTCWWKRTDFSSYLAEIKMFCSITWICWIRFHSFSSAPAPPAAAVCWQRLGLCLSQRCSSVPTLFCLFSCPAPIHQCMYVVKRTYLSTNF